MENVTLPTNSIRQMKHRNVIHWRGQLHGPPVRTIFQYATL